MVRIQASNDERVGVMGYIVADVRFVAGTYHGRTGRETSRQERGALGRAPYEVEWPPSPHRLLSAAVAGVGMREGADFPVGDHVGLRVLAELSPPIIMARRPQGMPVSFVQIAGPDNALHVERGNPARHTVLKGVQRALVREDETVTYAYALPEKKPLTPGLVEDVLQALMGVVALGRPMDDVVVHAYIAARVPEARGRSVHVPGADGMLFLPVPVPGSLMDMQSRQAAIRSTVAPDGRTVFRDVSPRVREVAYVVDGEVSSRGYVFSLMTAHGTPCALSPSIAPALVLAVRDAILSGNDVLPGSRHEVEIKGVGAGPSDLSARLRILPLPSVGHQRADGMLRRVAVILGETGVLRGHHISDALDGAMISVGRSRLILERAFGIDEPRAHWDGVTRMIMSERRAWRSATPMLLPGNLPRKAGRVSGKEEASWRAAAGSLALKALGHAGLDQSKVLSVSVRRNADKIDVPEHLARYERVDIQVEFDRPVPGPLALGPGRFLGLGIMVPILADRPSRLLSVRVAQSVPFHRCVAFADALRRIVIGTAGVLFGADKVPPSLSGHRGGRAFKDKGRHVSLHVHPDPSGAATERSIERFIIDLPSDLADRDVEVLIEGLRRVTRVSRFGSGGTGVEVTSLDTGAAEEMVKPSMQFRTMTPFRPSRSQLGPDGVAGAVVAQLFERNLPRPRSVEISRAVSLDDFEARQKMAASALMAHHVTIAFDVKVAGPLRLGADAHYGGGLFVPVRRHIPRLG